MKNSNNPKFGSLSKEEFCECHNVIKIVFSLSKIFTEVFPFYNEVTCLVYIFN